MTYRTGLEFNYTLNASCLGNYELKEEGHQEIIKLLDWISEIGVDTVTVSMPYIADLIKKRSYPLKVEVSTIIGVDSVQKAKFWENLGAEAICLDFMANRDFPLIKNIKKSVKTKLKVIVNDSCLYQCPFRNYDYNLAAHASQSLNHHLPQPYSSYPLIKCTLIKLTDLSQIIKSRWIRPEDLRKYREIGIDYFKISGRGCSREFILKCLKTYEDGEYDGNFLDILFFPINFLKGSNKALAEVIYIDNKALGNFLNHFEVKICEEEDCSSCNYCGAFVERAIRVKDKEDFERLISRLKEFEAHFPPYPLL